MRRTGWLLFALVWLSVAWFGSWEFNPNHATRLFAAISLVEDGDATIDEFAPATIDRAEFGGHFYSDKAPGMTLLALPAVWIADAATGTSAHPLNKQLFDPGLSMFLKLRLRLAVALIGAPLIAFAALLLFRLVAAETGDPRAGLVAALAFGLASPVWGWATTWLGHAPVAALYVIAIFGLWRGIECGRLAPGWVGAAGFALGWAVLIEFQAVLAGSAIATWGLWRAGSMAVRARVIALLGAGGAPALLLLLGYNQLAFGTPFKVAYSGVTGFQGMQTGLFGLGWPSPGVLVEVLFGAKRGLVWVAPWLAFVPVALVAMIRDKRSRSLGILVVAGAAIVLLVNAAYFYWNGGNSTGPRHAIPAIGFLAIALGFGWVAGPRERPWVIGLLALGGALNLVIATAEIFAPEGIRYPLWSHIAGRFTAGDLRTWPSEWLGASPWAGLALYLPLAIPLLYMLLRSVRHDCNLSAGNVERIMNTWPS